MTKCLVLGLGTKNRKPTHLNPIPHVKKDHKECPTHLEDRFLEMGISNNFWLIWEFILCRRDETHRQYLRSSWQLWYNGDPRGRRIWIIFVAHTFTHSRGDSSVALWIHLRFRYVIPTNKPIQCGPRKLELATKNAESLEVVRNPTTSCWVLNRVRCTGHIGTTRYMGGGGGVLWWFHDDKLITSIYLGTTTWNTVYGWRRMMMMMRKEERILDRFDILPT